MDNAKPLNSSPEKLLVEQLRDAVYRRAFVEGHAKDTVAFQLRAMRKLKGWEQRDVAEKLGNRKLQPMISRYENPDYGKYSVSTLLELAAVFDVALAIRFVEFSELVEWDLSSRPSKDCPIAYGEDYRLEEIKNGNNGSNQVARVATKPSPEEPSVCTEQSSTRPRQERSTLGSFNAADSNEQAKRLAAMG